VQSLILNLGKHKGPSYSPTRMRSASRSLQPDQLQQLVQDLSYLLPKYRVIKKIVKEYGSVKQINI
jgi:hypothetical protein